MDQVRLATQLIAASTEERAVLLAEHAPLVDRELAYGLKQLFDDAKNRDPARAVAVATALQAIARATTDPEALALADWTLGIAALMEGRMEQAITRLDAANSQFLQQGHSDIAAATLVSKLYALAMLGRYDEAIACGLDVQPVLLAHGDMLSAGKIEQNLGNLYFRREQYPEAEALYRSAYERFAALQDQQQLAQIETCLATTLSAQHRFQDAAALLEEARRRAEAAGLSITQAEIECNLGCLWLFQGRYDRALNYLERSRRLYAALGAPHDTAIAEQELADAYLELNLLEDAAAIYQRVVPIFTELGMGAEQARALAYHGRACLLLGRREEARQLLDKARARYAAEGNETGTASVMLDEAQLLLLEGDAGSAEVVTMEAERLLAVALASGRLLYARWLRSEAVRAQGRTHEARTQLIATLKDAVEATAPQIAHRCHTSLGLLAADMGDRAQAEAAFRRAITIIEDLRAPLPADEFRAAFLADKMTPYVELVRLCLEDRTMERAFEAFSFTERARARALVDMLHGSISLQESPRDEFEAELLRRLEEERATLNWLYAQINRPPDGEASRGRTTTAALRETVRQHEAMAQQLTRQLHQGHAGVSPGMDLVAIEELQAALGRETALLEYWSLDGELLAFIVTDEMVEVVRGLAHEQDVSATLDELRFQLDALHYGVARVGAHLPQLTARTQHFLAVLFDLLLKPIIGKLGRRRLVVVPHRMLHYVPFHALYDGARYLIEEREVSYAPSAAVLSHCIRLPRRPLHRAVLMGIADGETPRVRDEVKMLASLFPDAVTLLDESATLRALRDHVPAADVLHLACHGKFRPDNPLFSSLRLADGSLTVYEAYSLPLSGTFVALSACETGMSTVTPGDEIIGLARGFLSAGAPSLLVSLWNAYDDVTAELMNHFYTHLQTGRTPAAALRYAQCAVMATHEHPFFWAPFVVLGRW